MHKIITVVALSLLTASSAWGGPFGVNKGDKIQNYPAAIDRGDQMYGLPNVPKPHPLFTSYSVEAADGVGICRIHASSEPFDDDRFGIAAKQRYGEVRDQLVAIYGKGGGTDGEFIRDGALWDGPEEFVMALKQNERVHQTWWSQENGAKLKDGIKSIALAIKALNGSTSMLVIQYAFDNEQECRQAAEAASKSAL
ncbi:hypothetical protein [Agrobacterium tumefaciens]|uniref:hypothetical protein n=1 Tax=Agrobacterium tumefaciens TaxID=358 RepID=UPI0012697307